MTDIDTNIEDSQKNAYMITKNHYIQYQIVKCTAVFLPTSAKLSTQSTKQRIRWVTMELKSLKSEK